MAPLLSAGPPSACLGYCRGLFLGFPVQDLNQWSHEVVDNRGAKSSKLRHN